MKYILVYFVLLAVSLLVLAACSNEYVYEPGVDDRPSEEIARSPSLREALGFPDSAEGLFDERDYPY